jgi:hypothetical protein
MARPSFLVALFLFFTATSVLAQENPTADTSVRADLTLTLRLSPAVKPETIQLINRVTVPETVTLSGGGSVRSLLKRYYGDFYPKIEKLLEAYNPGLKIDSTPGSARIILPAGGRYFLNVLKPLTIETDLKSLIKRETGTDSDRTLKQSQLLTEALKAYCEKSVCTTQENRSLPQGVVLPYTSGYVSYTIKAEERGNIPAILEALKKDPGVTEAEVNPRSRLIPQFKASQLAALGDACSVLPPLPGWFIRAISLDRLPPEVLHLQNKVTIAVMDSGIDRDDGKDDSRFKLWQNDDEVRGVKGQDDDGDQLIDDKIGFNFLSADDYPLDDQFADEDFRNHGTHVAGLVSGRFLTGSLLSAVDDHLDIMVLKIADSDGFVDYGAVNDAILYARKKQARIANMSFEGPFSLSIQARMDSNDDKSTLYVVAAGNGNARHIGQNLDLESVRKFPAKFAGAQNNVISVAAHNERNELACFTNFGSKTVDLAAPGVEIESTVADNKLLNLSGTSQAAPLVTLTAALIYSQGVTDPGKIKQRILSSVDYVPEFKLKLVSEGKLNVVKAVSVYDDVVELKDADRTLLRGTLVDPPGEIVIDGKVIPFGVIRKIVNSSESGGQPIQRVTWLNTGKLEHVYGKIAPVTFTLKVGDACRRVTLDELSDLIPRSIPPSQPATCQGQ